MRLSLVGGSIRRALLTVVAVSVLPSLGIILLTGMEARRHAEIDAKASALNHARTIAVSQEKAAVEIQELLRVISLNPRLLRTPAALPGEFLANVLSATPNLADICLANGDAEFAECASGSRSGQAFEGALVRKALARRSFTPGGYVRFTGASPAAFTFALPLESSGESAAGALVAYVRLDAFVQLMDKAEPPEKAAVILADSSGRRLCTTPPESGLGNGPGLSPPLWDIVSREWDQSTFSMDSPGTGSTLYAHVPMRMSPGGEPYLHVLVGVPESQAMAAATRMLHRNLALLSSATLLALAIGWLLWKPLLGSRVDRLAAVTERLGAGDFSARTGDCSGSGELGLLERSVDAMAQSLAESAQKQQLYEAALRKSGEELEAKVRERTAQLSEANRLLKSEMLERAKAQLETARSVEKYRALYEQSAAGVILLDAAGTIMDANPSALALLGYSHDEIKGLPYKDIVQKENLERSPVRMDEILAGEAVLLERVYLSKSGAEIPAQAASSRIGENTLQVVFTDSTERMRYEKLRDDIERITRHDLKTPLMGMVQVPDLLLRSDNLTPKQREFLELLRESGYRMLHTINMSTVLYKMEANQYDCDRLDFDMLATVKRCASELAHMGKSKGVSIAVKLDGRLPDAPDSFVINGEELLCVTMLENLLKNAVEASPPESEVCIGLSARERSMTIRNKGEVPTGIRNRFFEKYSTEGKKWGTGLGTYSARLIAESHGWTIRLDSSVPGETSIVLGFPPVEAVTRNRAA